MIKYDKRTDERDFSIKVGDTVYCIMAQGVLGTLCTTGKPIPRIVDKIIWDGKRIEIYSARIADGKDNDCCFYGYLGDTVFRSEFEAEERLREIRAE